MGNQGKVALGVGLRIEPTLALGNGGRLSPVPAPRVATICSTTLDSTWHSSARVQGSTPVLDVLDLSLGLSLVDGLDSGM